MGGVWDWTSVFESWPWRVFAFLFLGSSVVGFFMVPANFVLIMEPLSSRYFAIFDVGSRNYLWLAPLFLALFPLAIGMTMWTVGRATPLVIAALLSIALARFIFLVPAIAVQRAFPLTCHGFYTEWQSVSYHFFGLGLDFPTALCFNPYF